MREVQEASDLNFEISPAFVIWHQRRICCEEQRERLESGSTTEEVRTCEPLAAEARAEAAAAARAGRKQAACGETSAFDSWSRGLSSGTCSCVKLRGSAARPQNFATATSTASASARGRRATAMRFASLDVYPKTLSEFRNRTASGGIVSVVCVSLIALLAIIEFADFVRVKKDALFQM